MGCLPKSSGLLTISNTNIFAVAAERIPPALADRLGPLLGRAHEAHRALSLTALAPLGLSPKGFGALAVLDAEGATSQQRLAERQGIDRTTMVAVVDELEGVGAVRRRRDPTDRRAYALEVTPAGRRLLARARVAESGAQERFMAPLSDEERRMLKDALRKLLEPPPPPGGRRGR
jgi:DNA-binding MarR family transcriptional regulator